MEANNMPFYTKEKPEETVFISKEKVMHSTSKNELSNIYMCLYSKHTSSLMMQALPTISQERRIRVYVKKLKDTEAAKV